MGRCLVLPLCNQDYEGGRCMILDLIIGFEPASLLWFILVNGFLFLMYLKVASGCFANALMACAGFLNKLTAILLSGLAARLIID